MLPNINVAFPSEWQLSELTVAAKDVERHCFLHDPYNSQGHKYMFQLQPQQQPQFFFSSASINCM